MKILALAPDVPATSRMPGSPRLFNFCRELSRKHELILLTGASSQERYKTFLADPTAATVFSRVELLPPPPALTWWGQQWHRAHLAAYSETRYRHPGYYRSMRAHVREVCEREHVDLIHADHLSTVQYVDDSMDIASVADLHDSLTLLRRRMLVKARGLREKLSVYIDLVGVRRLERQLGNAFDLVIMTSTVDEEVIKELTPASNTLAITNGVDMEYFSPDPAAREPDKIVFTGVMNYEPNEDAALNFVENILPLVQAKRPQVHFWIVGSGPSERIRALANIPGVHVAANVEDIRPYVRSAAVFVCPLRIGSGVKNKILAGMAMQTPIVATWMSIDGLDLADERELLLADDPESFAEKVVLLLSDPAAADKLRVAGLERVKAQYSWAAKGKAYEDALDAVMAARKARARR